MGPWGPIGSKTLQPYTVAAQHFLLQFPCWDFLLAFNKGGQETGIYGALDMCCQEEDRCQVHSRARIGVNPLVQSSKSLLSCPPAFH
jgi:hypothetical protein